MTGYDPAPMSEPATATGERTGIPLPLARPVATYVLLGLIVFVFLLETLFGGSTSTQTLLTFGAQVNALVAGGDYWRLLNAMFLHIGLMHLVFNCWALFSLGREVEALYGTWRFLVIYFVTGLFGNMISYALGPNVISAGASGAIFGLVGADIAFFASNRKALGRLSQQSLGNLAILVAINLVLGFTAPGINNYAHIGGLVSGLALGFGLTPRYAAVMDGWSPRLINQTNVSLQILSVALVSVCLLMGLWLGNQRWSALVPQRAPGQQGHRLSVPALIQRGSYQPGLLI